MKRLLLLSLLCATSPVWAWSRAGHAAVASLAEARLTPAAKAEVAALLKDDLDNREMPSGRTTLAEIASWPDEIRDVAPKGSYAGWHTRSNPVCSAELGACKEGACVDQKIIYYTAILKDHTQSHRARNEALKFVVHFVGDLHQPLHSGSNNDSSGSKIRALLANGKSKTLHQYWDHDASVAGLKQGPLTGDERMPALNADSPTQWVQEIRDISRREIYDGMPGFTCGERSPATLEITPEYARHAAEVARKQMWQAGLRLAQILNATLGN
jgi:hypothetical protein